MTEEIPADSIRWTRAWNIAGAHLAGERAARLRAMADDDARKIIERELKPLLAIQGGQPVWDHLDELRQELSFGDR